MKGQVMLMIDDGSALVGEAGGEDGIEAQQSSGVIFDSEELGVQSAECFGIGFVPCSEHCDLCFSRVSAISQEKDKPTSWASGSRMSFLRVSANVNNSETTPGSTVG